MEAKLLTLSRDVLVASEYNEHLLKEVAAETALIGDLPIDVDDVKCFNSIWATRNPQPSRLFTIGTMSLPSYSEGVFGG